MTTTRLPSVRILFALACCFSLGLSAFAAGTHVKAAKPLRISQGERVELTDFLVPGKFTIFDFTASIARPAAATMSRSTCCMSSGTRWRS